MSLTRIGNYQILGELGQGGMGIVYRARHVNSERAVALKTVKKDIVPSARWLESLRREIHALTRIRHPGIVRIVDHGVDHGLPWYAMDLLEGERLADFCRRFWSPYRWATMLGVGSMGYSQTRAVASSSSEQAGTGRASVPPLSEDGKPPAAAGQLKTVLRCMRRVCATLAFLHGEGFINCDLTPNNILLVAGEPVVIDFGLTAQHSGSSRESAESPQLFGTLPYMSPEQLRGEFVDARSDLYSVGCVLYELVTGRPPFNGPHRLAFVQQHLSEQPTPPSEFVNDLPEELEQLILRLLAKNLSDRYGHADEVAVALAALTDDARHLSSFPPARPYLYRPRLVGREAVVDQLASLRRRTLFGAGALAFIGGESGVGKTRVAMELTRLELGSNLRVVTTEAAPLVAHGTDTLATPPLFSLRPLLRAIADRCHEGGCELTEQLLGPRRAVLARYEPLLAEVPSASPLEPEVPLSEQVSRQRLFSYLAESLALFALDQPLLWLWDDIGWADKLSLAFLRSLDREFFEQVPVFVLGTYRSEESNDDVLAMANQAHVTHLQLQRLDRGAVASMIQDMLALPEVPNDFLAFVAERGDGNPFFVAEYLRAAVNERLLFRSEQNHWQLQSFRQGSVDPFETLSLPSSLRDLLGRRLRSLSPVALQAVRAAAALGRDVEFELLRHVAALDSESAVGAVDELVRSHVFEEQVGRLRFAHDQLRAVAYSEIPLDLGKVLHDRAAHELETRWQDRGDAHEVWPALGHHFEKAGIADSAARYLKLAAEHARATYANLQAVQLHRRAIPIVSDLAAVGDASWKSVLLEHHESLGDILALTSQRAEARSAYDAALAATPETSVVLRARLLRKLGKTWEAEHQHDQALEWYAQGRAMLGAQLDFETNSSVRDEWVQMHVEELWVHYWLNRVSDMEATVARVATVMELSGSTLQRSKFFHAQAMKNLRRDSYTVSEETLSLVERTLAICSGGQLPLELPMVQFFYGFCLLLQGSLDRAEAELSKALGLARRAGEIGHQARCLTYVTLLARLRGSLDDARSLAQESLELSARSNLQEYVAAAWANQSWVALRCNDLAVARLAGERALKGWRELRAVFPFHWLALLPLMHVELEEKNLSRAVEHAEGLFAPGQQALPKTALKALGQAIEHFKQGDHYLANEGLRDACTRLESQRYS